MFCKCLILCGLQRCRKEAFLVFFREFSKAFVSIFFAVNDAFLEKSKRKKRYKDVVKVRLIPLCKMRLYQCLVREGDILSYDLRLIALLI